MGLPIRTAAIIGVNWGLVHLQTLRDSRIDVVALVSKDLAQAQAAAELHGIPVATDNLDDIGVPDVVIVATPAFTHATVIKAFPYSHIFCEKPVLGPKGDINELPPWTARTLFNYAFTHLQTAKRVQALMPKPERVTLTSSVSLSGFAFNTIEWFFEIASHPVSWLFDWLGGPVDIQSTVSDEHCSLQFKCGTTHIDVRFTVGGTSGIHHAVEAQHKESRLTFSGAYSPGNPWWFGPVVCDGAPINDGEVSEDDVWLRANRASLKLALKVFRGDISPNAAEEQGAFGLNKALWVERLFNDDFTVGFGTNMS